MRIVVAISQTAHTGKECGAPGRKFEDSRNPRTVAKGSLERVLVIFCEDILPEPQHPLDHRIGFGDKFDNALRRQAHKPIQHRRQRNVLANRQVMHDRQRNNGICVDARAQSKPLGLRPALFRARIGGVGEQRKELQALVGCSRYGRLQRVEV
jgi:hypothetical protein